MSEEADPDLQGVAALIEGYLAAYPAAGDTDEGVAQWWLPAMGADVPIETVRAALEWLVQRGVLERTQWPGGPAVYRGAARPPRGTAGGNGG